MSVVINTNFAATVASNNLAASNDMLQRSMNRLSSGSKIVNPADDAGGLSVSFLQSQDGVLKVTGKVLERMGELRTLYNDPTKNTDDKANYDSEFIALKAELDSLTAETFNGVALFGTTSLSVAVSEDGSSSVTIADKDLSSTADGVGALIASGITSLADIDLSDITDAIQSVATYRATNGAEQSRLGFALEVLTVNKANLESANSRIIDVDVASESTQLARWNVLVQSGTAMLAQANQSAQTALRLLQ
jgi:flagellin